ncbi:MAG TPA: GGDEF domain-containing protein [Methylophaga aminisulfidivorans]|uniref:GGDEF domain-containing protein n=2 Tax=root TaxID=1 RepID=A0A7C2ACC7_9GAMM|nr:GGDEF domain-containing protein [Methylophaga aminisulfidivorans]
MTQEEAHHYNLLQEILSQGRLTALFQPIVSLVDRKIFGYEGLIRGPSDSPLHSPVNLFDTALKHNLLAELDLLCRETVIKRYGQLGLKAKLFINTTPVAIMDNDYPHGLTMQYVKQAGLTPQQVIIELTEQYPIDDYELMRVATEHYRQSGFSIAIDDLGAGYSGLRTWSELKPDYVKLDGHFMQNIHDDRQKRHFVQSMIDIAQSVGCQIIGEGIEVRQEYLTAQSLDMRFVQGYYFGRPNRNPLKELDKSLFAERNKSNIHSTGRPRSNTLVSSLLNELEPVLNNSSIDQVAERFQKTISLNALPVVTDNNRVSGIVWRDDFMTMYASRFGRELYGRKPIDSVMDTQPIIVETDLPLKKLSYQITSQETQQQHSAFIITEQGRYRGVGSLMDLLRQITDMQITMARHANPLSGLPGNVPLSELTREIIERKRDVTVCYFDLDNFKPYNDIYGYGKGDKVISLTAKMLTQHVDQTLDFVGHVGGDDFIILFESNDWLERCESMLTAFEALYPELYNPRHLTQKGINAVDRHGNETFYPLLSLSIGAVSVLNFEGIEAEIDLTEHASKAKSMAKRLAGNSIYQLQSEDAVVVSKPRIKVVKD